MTRLAMIGDPLPPEEPGAAKPPRHVWIALPAYTGTVHLGTMRSIVTDLLTLFARGDRVEIVDEAGNGLLADARALLVAKFLASEATDLVFVDWDVAWEAGALVRLVDQPVDFAAGVYRGRKDPEEYAIQYMPDPEKRGLYADKATGLLKIAGLGFGFVRLTRALVQKMVDAYPDTIFYCEPAPDQRAWALFADYRVGLIKFGEDFAFCRRWRDIGGDVWIDPMLKMGHTGFKTFLGCFGDWLRNRPADEGNDGDTSPRDREGRPSGA